MVYAKNQAILKDKKFFFNQTKNLGMDITQKIEAVNDLAISRHMNFLRNNLDGLQKEFTSTFEYLKKADDKNKEAFWLYCYYCASLLEVYHRSYNQSSKEKEYRELKVKIVDRLKNGTYKESPAQQQSFINSLYANFIDSINSLITTPLHISQIRDNVAFINISRVYWAFCRMTITEGLAAAKSLNIIEKIDSAFGLHTDVDKIISNLNAPNGVLSYFSVGLFLARFMIDGGLLLKHTFFPTALERGDFCTVFSRDKVPEGLEIDGFRNSYVLIENDGVQELHYIPKAGKPIPLKTKENLKVKLDFKGKKALHLNAKEIKTLITDITGHTPEKTTFIERFKFELYKRHCRMANDIVWATVNFLTNLNHISHIPAPITGYITAAFLWFDVGMALYKCQLAKKEYLTKKAQYEQEMEEYFHPEKHKHLKGLSESDRLMHIEMLKEQLYSLEVDWRTKESTFYFSAAAASLLMLGFTASMIVSPPVLAVGCFFVCTVAAAMYLSEGAYSEYCKKSLYLEHAKESGKNLKLAQKEYEIARNQFFFTIAKNTVVPIVLITTFAVCWQAALVLTAMYIGFELLYALLQNTDKNDAKKLALSPG